MNYFCRIFCYLLVIAISEPGGQAYAWPVPTSPTGNTIINSSTVRFTVTPWTPPATVPFFKYIVDIQRYDVNNGLWITCGADDSLWTQVSDGVSDVPGMPYDGSSIRWRVQVWWWNYWDGSYPDPYDKGIPPNGTGSWSTYAYFYNGDVPTTPTPLTPANGAQVDGGTVTFSWSASPRTVYYYLQVAETSSFGTSDLVVDSSVGNVTTIAKTLSCFDNTGKTFYWRIKAHNYKGDSSYSTTLSFRNGTPPLTAPTLWSPANAQSLTASPTIGPFQWFPVSYATSYHLQIATDNAFNNVVSDTSGITSQSGQYIYQYLTDTDFINDGTMYYWRVRACNASGEGPNSETRTFKNGAAVPSVPSLSTPGNNSVVRGTSLTFSWNAADGANDYELQVAFSSAFGDTTVATCLIGSRTTSKTYTGDWVMDDGCTYYWRVRAKNNNGFSSYSSIWHVKNGDQPPGLPYPSIPNDGAVLSGDSTDTFSFQWTAAPRAVDYQLQISKSPYFTTVVYDQWVGLTTGITLTDLPFLDDGCTYYWRVQADNFVGPSGYAGYRRFQNGDQRPASPTLISPADEAQVDVAALTFQWSPATHANTYQVVILDSSFCETYRSDLLWQTFAVDLPYVIAGDGRYYWWYVAARNYIGWSTMGETRCFTTVQYLPDTPALAFPANNSVVCGNTISFGWNAAERAEEYYLQIASDDTFRSGIIYADWVGPVLEVELADLFFDDGCTYYWRIKAKNTHGESAFSGSRTFQNGNQIPATPSLSYPIDGQVAPGTSVGFLWSGEPRTVMYRFQLALDPYFTATAIVRDEWVDDIPGAQYVSYTMDRDLVDDGCTYYWRVKAKNFIGESAFSDVDWFVNGDQLPAAPTLVSPANASVVPGVTVTFEWESVLHACDYHLEVSTDIDFRPGTFVYSGSVGLFTRITLQDRFLDKGRTYYWRVRSGNFVGDSAFPEPYRFINGPSSVPTQPHLSAPLEAAQVNQDSVLFRWEPAARATDYCLLIANDADFTKLRYAKWFGDERTEMLITGFPNAGLGYYWCVAARNSLGTGPWSDVRMFRNGSATFPPPTDLSVTCNRPGGVYVKWTLPSTPPPSIYVLRCFTLWYAASDPMGNVSKRHIDLLPEHSKGIYLSIPDTGTQYFRMRTAYSCEGTDFFSDYSPLVTTDILPVLETPTFPRSTAQDMATGSKVTITWTPSSTTSPRGIDSYRVWRNYYGRYDLHPWTLLATVPASSLTFVDDTANNDLYLYCVSAVTYDNAGQRHECLTWLAENATYWASVEVTDQLSPKPPSNPRILLVNGTSDTQLTFTWDRVTHNTDNSPITDLIGYRIDRRDLSGDGTWTLVTQTDADTTAVTEHLTLPGHQLEYRIVAIDRNGNTSLSVSATVVLPDTGTPPVDTPPTAPTDLSFVDLFNETALMLTWAPSLESDIASYKVFRRTGTSGPFALRATVTHPLNVTTRVTFVDRTVVPNTTYQYYVKAVDRAGNESDPSSTVANATKFLFLHILSPLTETPLTVKPANGDVVDIQWSISKWYATTLPTGLVELEIVDSKSGQLIYDTFELIPLPTDDNRSVINTFTWNCKWKSTGKLVSGGTYDVTLRLFDKPDGNLVESTTQPQSIVVETPTIHVDPPMDICFVGETGQNVRFALSEDSDGPAIWKILPEGKEDAPLFSVDATTPGTMTETSGNSVWVTPGAKVGVFTIVAYLPNTPDIADASVLTVAKRKPPRIYAFSTTGHRRVDFSGVPLLDPDPTGEELTDRPVDKGHVDMYTRQPQYSKSDVRIPLEGGDLFLEFRRTLGVRGYQVNDMLGYTGYANDTALGPGWDTSLSPRVLIRVDDHGRGGLVASVRDEVGDSYDYFWTWGDGESRWRPDIEWSLNRSCLKAKLENVGSVVQNLPPETLRLTRAGGTKLTFTKVGVWTDTICLRLMSIEDRNGNKIVYDYTGSPAAWLPSKVFEDRHPDRALSFTYEEMTDRRGRRVQRLISIKDPLNRETHYEYYQDGGMKGFLRFVRLPAIENPDNPQGSLVNPTTEFSYYQYTLPGSVGAGTLDVIAPQRIVDPRGHATSFAYDLKQIPCALTPLGQVLSEQAPVLTTITCRDTGISTFGDDIRDVAMGTGQHNVRTWVRDAEGTITRYRFIGDVKKIVSSLSARPYSVSVTNVTRITELADSTTPTVVFEYSNDNNANLTRVVDVNSTVTLYTYSSGETADPYDAKVPFGQTIEPAHLPNYYQCFDRPAKKVLDPSGLNLITHYRYEPAFNRSKSITDARGVKSEMLYDNNGNLLQLTRAKSSSCPVTTFHSYNLTDHPGFRVSTKDPDGRLTVFVPDAYGNLKDQIVKGYANELSITTTYEKDIMGRTLTATDPNLNMTSYQYDNLDRLTKTTYPVVTAGAGYLDCHYDLNGNLLSTFEENGDNDQVVTHTYDEMDRQLTKRIRMTSPDTDDDTTDIITRKTYFKVGLCATSTDANGGVTSLTYDGLGRIRVKSLPPVTLPNSTRTTYVESYEYGLNSGFGTFLPSAWQPTRVINPRGFATDQVYDRVCRMVRQVERRNNGTDVAFDAPPRSATSTQTAEPASTFVYDPVGNRITVDIWNDDVGGNRTTYFFYNSLNRLRYTIVDMDIPANGVGIPPGTIADGDLPSASFHLNDIVHVLAYDLTGHVTKEIDALKCVTWYFYDGLGRKIRTTLPSVPYYPTVNDYPYYQLTPDIYYSYDNADNNTFVSAMWKFNGSAIYTRTAKFFDARNRQYQTIVDRDQDGLFENNGHDTVVHLDYDVAGNVITTTDANSHATRTEYDRAFRSVKVTQPSVHDAESGQTVTPIQRVSYDKNSNVRTRTDARGIIAETVYDELGRSRFVRSAVGTADEVTKELQHDPNGNVVCMILHNRIGSVVRDQKTLYDYDPYDRQTKETLPNVGDNLTRQHSTTYYRDGSIKTTTDAKGQVTTHTYDRHARDLAIEFKQAGGALSEHRDLSYDKEGRLLNVTEKKGSKTSTSKYTYDSHGRIWTESRLDAGGTEYTTTSAYDLLGNRVRVTLQPTGTRVYITYDALNKPIEQSSSGPGLPVTTTSFKYDFNGNQTNCTLPNGVVRSFEYDALNRQTRHIDTKGGSVVYSAVYLYDQQGNRRQLSEITANQGTRAVLYGYDLRYQLTSESWTFTPLSGSVITEASSYDYDLAGNRLTSVYKKNNVVTSTRTSTYDDLNRHTKTVTTGTGASTTDYTYDLNGNRLTKKIGTSTWTYTYDTQNRLTEFKKNATTKFNASYDYRTRRVSKTENGTTTYFRYDGGVCVEEVVGSTITAAFLRDSGMGGGIGSIILSKRGSTIEYYSYNAVGSTAAVTDPSGLVKASWLYDAFGRVAGMYGTSSNNRLANTKERDASLGLDNHGYRYYDPETGRYITPDPLGYKDGPNPYLYVHNNPVNLIDPQGLDLLDDAANFCASFGDTISFGVSRALRRKMDIDTTTNYRSGAYKAGGVAGEGYNLAVTATGIGGAAKAVAGQVAKYGVKVAAKQIAIETVKNEAKDFAAQKVREQVTSAAIDSGLVSDEETMQILEGAGNYASMLRPRFGGKGASGGVGPELGFAAGKKGKTRSVEGGGIAENHKLGRKGALNEAKKDLDIPRSTHPDGKPEKVPMTDRRGNWICGPDGKPIMTRQYTYTRRDGSKVLIQDHSAGHDFGENGVGDQGPHFNVRPPDQPRTGHVEGTKDHYGWEAK